ncbi:MAG TPA: basic secretory protein-like protein [Armatimonadota bacterium]
MITKLRFNHICGTNHRHANLSSVVACGAVLLLAAGASQAFQAAPVTPPAGPGSAGFTRPDRSGTIKDIKGDVFTLTSRRGDVTVTIPATATIDRIPDGKASRADLKVDARIGVYGAAKDDGSFTATRVVLLPARPASVTVTPPSPPALSAEALAASKAKLEKDTPEITLDTTGAPDLAGFAGRAKAICEAYYPFISAYLHSDGVTPPSKFTQTYREMSGVAYTSGDGCFFSAAYFRSHPDDYGAVVHEMTHVIQNYHGNNPGWLVEAVDDYIRFYRYEPMSKALHFTADRVPNDPQAYQIGAQFLDWAQAKYDKNLVPELNTAMRAGTYSDDIWKQKTNKAIADLWAEWKATLPAGAPKPTVAMGGSPAKQ